MTRIKDFKEKLIAIEMKLAFQDELLDTLNEVVTKQSKELQNLWDANRLLKQSINEVKSDAEEPSIEMPPPHY